MNFAKETDNIFRPHRGKENAILNSSSTPGYMYYATDTHRMYFDLDSSTRTGVRGEGVVFVYGTAGEDEVIESEEGYDVYLFPKDKIIGHYNQDDIIINSDNTFYRINDILSFKDYVACDKMLIAGTGSGGGSGSSNQTYELRTRQNFPSVIPKGQSAKGIFYVKSQVDDIGRLYIRMRRDPTDVYPTFETWKDIKVGQDIEVEIPASWFVSGDKNFVQLQVMSYTAGEDQRISQMFSMPMTCLDISFGIRDTWNPRTVTSVDSNLEIPWGVKIAGSVAQDIKENLIMTIDWSFDGIPIATENITNLAKVSTGIYTFSKDIEGISFTHGAHKIEATAILDVYGTKINIGEIYQEVALFEKENYTTIIWSPLREELNIEKYTLLNIPYMIYRQGANTPLTVLLSINGELIDQGREQSYMSNTWLNWEVTNYNDGENTLTINCGDAKPKIFYVNVKNNAALSDAEAIEDDCVLHLTTKGRSNDESAIGRVTWLNEAKTVDTSIIDFDKNPISFNGFNWYNNGWIKDADNNTVLRLSNGASVNIPMTAITTEAPQPRTYEIDFKVRNAINFSKLIDIEPVLDENGKPIEDPDPTNEDNTIPRMKKSVRTTDGVFLKYFDTNKKHGFCLGTQEAFYSINVNDLVNVRYADNERVKVSFVVNPDSNDNKLYVYLNGVITGIYVLPNKGFDAKDAAAIQINSDYCDVDIYNIRVYKSALDYDYIVRNWIGDSSTLQIMLNRYANNKITTTDSLGNITIDYEAVKKAQIIPIMVIKTHDREGLAGADNRLPYMKDSEKIVSVRYYNPFDLSKNFKCQNVILDVQGTSSQGYPRRNYKLKLKQGSGSSTLADIPFKVGKWDGNDNNVSIWNDADNLEDGYDLGYGMPEETFCLKADYMESSGTHNTGLANYIQYLINSNIGKTYDLSHPLYRLAGQTYARTTIYGFPILLFHELDNKDSNEDPVINFIGKYNFNIDKGATDSFGFTYDAEQPYDKNHRSYAEVAECWEFKNNQGGLGKFSEGQFDSIIADGEKKGRLEASVHFEPRYHHADFDIKDMYKAANAQVENVNKQLLDYMSNFRSMWEWVASTDVSISDEKRNPVPFDETKYYLTRDTEWNIDHHYYIKDGDTYTEVQPNYVDKFVASDEGRKDDQGNVLPSTKINTTLFLSALLAAQNLTNEEKIQAQNVYIYHYDASVNKWKATTVTEDESGNEQINLIAEISTEDLSSVWGITLPTDISSDLYSTWVFSITYSQTIDNWSGTYYQGFNADTNDYRLSKFATEFTQHFNLPHTLFYFIMTELLLLYDSRQKNMMLATWGPEQENGEYIWYPIFYDMDTQLGINNSGQVYWDYDVDATPKDNVAQSIFSGTGSVLWANVFMCFENQIKSLYQQLRVNGLTEVALRNHYDKMQSDKWTEQMKNIDAFYKYIAPSSIELYGGYTNTSGSPAETSAFFYCLQGDRKLNRDLFFRNRLNYIDSYWQGGDYDSTYTDSVIIRYNLNDRIKTSDDDSEYFNGSPSFTITPYLSQYVSLAYDEILTSPVRYQLSLNKPITVHPSATIQKSSDNGVVLTQQLVYFRGPAFLSDLGDLSKNYLNQFSGGPAIRLRNLKLGDDAPGYKNQLLTKKDLTLDSSATSYNAKTLLETLDLSNLNEYSGSLDIGGCIKIKHLKLLGTATTDVTLPKGNLLTRAYFPSTITHINLITPLNLTSIITDSRDVAHNNNHDGLYIEGLTDQLNNEINALSTTNILTYQMDDTKLGYDTYRMLKYLYDVKCQAQAGNLANSEMDKTLRIQVKNAEWSPYHKLDSDLPALPIGKPLYYLTSMNTYEVYDTTKNTWKEDLRDLGIYEKVDEYKKLTSSATYDDSITYYQLDTTGAYQTVEFETQGSWETAIADKGVYIKLENPITDFAMFETFMNQKDINKTPKDKYYFKALQDDAGGAQIRIMPVISGNIHINNTEDTPLSEWTIYSSYNSDEYYPNLTITANYVTPCYRVQFIEYNDKGEQIIHGYLKSSPADAGATEIKYSNEVGETPFRLHYDFLGWTTAVEDMKKTNSIVINNDDVPIVINAQGNWTGIHGKFSEAITDVNTTLTLCAVYKLTLYDVEFIDGDQNVIATLQFSSKDSVYPPSIVPSKNSSDLPLEEFYHFIGYSALKNGGESALINFDSGRIHVSGPTRYYAQFEQANIYDYPLPEDQLLIQIDNNSAGISIDPSYGHKDKICLPTTVTVNGQTYPVTSILGNSIIDGKVPGFYDNNTVTHVFMQGTPNNTCTITTISANAFQLVSTDTKIAVLEHVDIPQSLTSIHTYAFAGQTKLYITNCKNVTTFGRYSFQNNGVTNTNALPNLDDTGFAMILGGGNLTLSSYAFDGLPCLDYRLGSEAQPVTSLNTENNMPFPFVKLYNWQINKPIKILVYASDAETANTIQEKFKSAYSSSPEYIDLTILTVE